MKLVIKTQNKKEVVDITDKINEQIEKQNVKDGVVNLFLTHTTDHILSSLVGTSLTLPVEDGQLVLGTWQKVVLIEFDGPRDRQIVLNFI